MTLTTPQPGAVDQRSRILDAALGLMSEQGAAGTSMRRVAAACGLNVATIYHYFPSKADLLRAVIEERRYGERIAAQQPPVDRARPAPERLVTLLEWVWEQTQAEHTVLRLLLGEGVRGDPTAQQSTRDLIATLDAGLAVWITQGFPELADHGVDPGDAARLIRRQFLALEAEFLATGRADATRAATDIATALFRPRDP